MGVLGSGISAEDLIPKCNFGPHTHGLNMGVCVEERGRKNSVKGGQSY